MKRNILNVCARILVCLTVSSAVETSYAHQGRRFQVMISEGKLVAQGMNTKQFLPPGEKKIRPYFNALHDNFTNVSVNGKTYATASLPGFDIAADYPLLHGYSIICQVTRVFTLDKDEAQAVSTFTIERLETTEPPSVLTIQVGSGEKISSVSMPGEITLIDKVLAMKREHIDVHYQLNHAAINALVIVELILKSTAPQVSQSDTIYIVLSPPGKDFHPLSLRLEESLSTRQSKPQKAQ